MINMAMTAAWMTARNLKEGLNEAIAEDMEKDCRGGGGEVGACVRQAVTSKEEEVNKVTGTKGMRKTNGAENYARLSLPRTECGFSIFLSKCSVGFNMFIGIPCLLLDAFKE